MKKYIVKYLILTAVLTIWVAFSALIIGEHPLLITSGFILGLKWDDITDMSEKIAGIKQ